MTQVELNPTNGTQPKRRWPRVSLLTWILLLFIAGLFISNLATTRRLNEAEKELAVFRREAGVLTVDDASRICVIRVPTAEENTWRWRWHLPAGSRFALHLSSGDAIPADGITSDGNSLSLDSGQYLATSRLRKVDDQRWVIETSLQDAQGRQKAIFSHDAQGDLPPAESERRASSTSVGADTNGSESFDPSNPVVLLRRRLMKSMGPGKFEPTNDPMPGVLIWIEKQ